MIRGDECGKRDWVGDSKKCVGIDESKGVFYKPAIGQA